MILSIKYMMTSSARKSRNDLEHIIYLYTFKPLKLYLFRPLFVFLVLYYSKIGACDTHSIIPSKEISRMKKRV